MRDTFTSAALVDPRSADTVLVAARGHVLGPNEERGVFRTEDGGKSWRKVLFKDADTGAVDLAADPAKPLFGQGPLLDEYLPRVRAAAQRAQTAPAYRAALEPAAEAHTEKQKISVGLPEKHRARRTRR